MDLAELGSIPTGVFFFFNNCNLLCNMALWFDKRDGVVAFSKWVGFLFLLYTWDLKIHQSRLVISDAARTLIKFFDSFVIINSTRRLKLLFLIHPSGLL